MLLDAAGNLVMNPIPGEAGTDYPVFNAVPDTGFDCSQQDFPGIYTDTEADCQVSTETEPDQSLNPSEDLSLIYFGAKMLAC